MPFLPPNQQRQSTEGKYVNITTKPRLYSNNASKQRAKCHIKVERPSEKSLSSLTQGQQTTS